MAEVGALTLASICLDVQICICLCLHPSDILALRKTCKALQLSTRQRVVWVAALHRVCLNNTLFLPSFPISDMSDLEVESAAIAPHRWIELYGAFEKQHLNDPDATLRPRSTRIIDDLFVTAVDEDGDEMTQIFIEFFIVPGGRYLVSASGEDISVLDLGHTSSADCKLIASVELKGEDKEIMVQATPDGMGLIIFSTYALFNCSVYEIYPDSETPRLTRIAHLELDFDITRGPPAHHLSGTVIWFGLYRDEIRFTVWDYRLNHSIKFFVDFGLGNKYKPKIEVMATKTTVIVLCEEAVLICAIPPLLPQPPDFFERNLTHIPPLFTIPLPDGIVLHSKPTGWKTISSWYFDSSQPLYFDMLCQGPELHRFQIKLEPDLSTASLHFINTSGLKHHNFDGVSFQDYRICEDTLFSCWTYTDYDRNYPFQLVDQYECGVSMGLTSACSANIISHGNPAPKMLLSNLGRDYLLITSCPASGRFVRLDTNNSVSVLDFF